MTGISGEKTVTLSEAKSQPQVDEMPVSIQSFTCELCGGKGFVIPDVSIDHPDFGHAAPCQCRSKHIGARKLSQFDAVSQLRHLSNLTFESFRPIGIGLTEDKQRNLQGAYQACMRFADEPEGWMMLRGGYGCGKTHLAAAIANHQMDKGREVIFITVPDLLDHLRATFNPKAGTAFDERFQQIKDSAMLILDDLGTQSSTPWAQEKLFQILNARHISKLPTVITTNLELEDFDLRLRSRLADLTLVQIVTITAPDFRQTGVAQGFHELSSLSIHANKTFATFDLRKDLKPEHRKNLKQAYDIAQKFAQSPKGWLFLTGAYGNGKTHLAAAIANHWRQQGLPVLFISIPDLLDELRATFHPNSTESYSAQFHRVRSASHLILDDLGSQQTSRWANEKLFQIIEYRHSAQLTTVLTTAQRYSNLDERLRSRLSDTENCVIYSIKAPRYYSGKSISDKHGEQNVSPY